jgi:translation initiation factor eIF-2B subunit beta
MEMDSLKFLIGEEEKTTYYDTDLRLSKKMSVEDHAIRDLEQRYKDFKANIQESLLEIESDIEEAYEAISGHCFEQIQDNDTILTIGYSSTVLELFKDASKDSRFTIVVVENSPLNSGKVMHRMLKNANINAILISDSSVFAYMSKINKVIISTRAIMADGGLITDSGVELVVLAAEYHTVPVIVVSAIYKLTPLYPFDNTTFNTFVSPELVLNSKEFRSRERVDVIVSFTF